MRNPLHAALAAAFLLWPLDVMASGFSHECFICEMYVPVGLNIGAAIHPGEGTGLLVGGEVSVLDLRDAKGVSMGWGGYGDVLYDNLWKTWRFSVGPEVIIVPGVGFDAGPAVELNGEDTRAGLRVRYFAAFPFLTPYVGAEYLFWGAERMTLEAGLLLKFPLPKPGNFALGW